MTTGSGQVSADARTHGAASLRIRAAARESEMNKFVVRQVNDKVQYLRVIFNFTQYPKLHHFTRIAVKIWRTQLKANEIAIVICNIIFLNFLDKEIQD